MTRVDSAAAAGFWNRPTLGKTVLFVVGYLVLYLGVGFVIGTAFDGSVDDENVVASAESILVGVAAPVAVGALALLIFVARLGWTRDIFGRRSRGGARPWMWVAPALVLAAVVAHLAGTDLEAWTGRELAAMAFLGVCVGLAEELATRGVAVKLLRDAGHGERYVAVVSSLLFALMHTVNLASGMSVGTVVATVVYTFGFGMCMYLSMRVTGTIWTAIVLHGLTDPTTVLATGGIDQAVAGQDSGSSAVAGLATVGLIVFGFVSVLLLRREAREAGSDARPAAR